MLTIGKVLKPQGIKGELKISSLLDEPQAFTKFKQISLKGTTFAVESVRIDGNFVYIKLATINDMNTAELYRNCDVLIEKILAPKLPAGRFYITDLIGCKMVADGMDMGELVDIDQFGSADIYSVQFGDKKFMFPALKKILLNIDIDSKIITIDKDELQKVAVYED